MALPVVLIHGYSSEGRTAPGDSYDARSLRRIYGRLVNDLQKLDANIVSVNLSRYISLDDGVSLEDVSLAMDRVLHRDHPELLESGFDVIIHSTGALVTRNWIRRYTKPGNCPVRHLVHLAGANFGSGWAHVGSSQVARFGRDIFQGTQTGLAVLRGLELASSWAIDLHLHFLQDGQHMLKDYSVMEFCLVGSQVPPEYFLIPVRYGREDGSDGVVRVSASNLNFNYLVIGSTTDSDRIDWHRAADYAGKTSQLSITHTRSSTVSKESDSFYEVKLDSKPGARQVRPSRRTTGVARHLIPFAIPYATNHSDKDRKGAIVSGDDNREDVLSLIRSALAATPDNYADRIAEFDATTARTYERVSHEEHSKGLLAGVYRAIRNAVSNPEGQYDAHSQLVIRVTDQFGMPVNNFSVYFNSYGGDSSPDQLINRLFEDKHRNEHTPNCVNFYLRSRKWDGSDWKSQIEAIKGATLEIDAIDPLTQRVLFIPLRMKIVSSDLLKWIEPHRTTVIDIQLTRLPHHVTFIMRQA
ncbi:hypothetical protein KDL29_09740 [bacterium]|nr:hypothetical protein [bacterium]